MHGPGEGLGKTAKIKGGRMSDEEFEELEAILEGSGKVYRQKDDLCDWTAVIIYRMRKIAAIHGKEPYRAEPKPIYTGSNVSPLNHDDKINIGTRRYYSGAVMLSVYQFHRHGMNEHTIADDIGIPVGDVRKIMLHKTQTQRRMWQMAQQQSHLPPREEILRRLAREN